MQRRSLILQRQVELREVGRIRIGEKKKTAAGKDYPAGRDTFRFTSSNKILLEALQKEFGGTIGPFLGFPGQWDLSSDAAQISVIVTFDNVSQSYEQWSGGGCTHRCDGENCHRVIVKKKGDTFEVDEHDVPCVCDPEGYGIDLPDRERDCKLKTRLKVMIPGSKDIGLWRLESGGVIFADETMALLRQFEKMNLGPVYCILTLGWQEIKKPGQKPSKFVVPSISVDPNPPAFAATMVQSTLSHQIRQELAKSNTPALTSNAGDDVPVEVVAAHVVEDPQQTGGQPETQKEPPKADYPLPHNWTTTKEEARRMAMEWEKELGLSKDKANWEAFQATAAAKGFYWPALLIMAKEEGADNMPDAIGFLHGWTPPAPKDLFEVANDEQVKA